MTMIASRIGQSQEFKNRYIITNIEVYMYLEMREIKKYWIQTKWHKSKNYLELCQFVWVKQNYNKILIFYNKIQILRQIDTYTRQIKITHI